MKKNILLAALVASGFYGFTQAPDVVLEKWSASPALHILDVKYSTQPAVVLEDKRRVEYIDKKDGLVTYKTVHKIVRVNDDKGIESYNKIYLPVANNADIIDIKARTILPSGKIMEVDKKNIKDIKE